MEFDLRRVLDALPAMVWIALPDGQLELVNRSWSEYTGLGLDEARGAEWQTAAHPDDLPALLERWQSILASGQPGEMDARVRRFDGQYRRVRVQCSPMPDNAGRIIKWCGTVTDVEDFRRAEETLRRRELDFQLIVDSIPLPVAVTTPSGEVEGLNQLTLDYFGRTFEELKGWKASDVVHPDDLERTIAEQLAAHQGDHAYNVESRHRRADGVYRWYNVLGLPLRDPQGNILRWLHLLIDIDDRRQAEAALQAANDRLARASQVASLVELSASIAHEVNQPIAAALANAQAALRWLRREPPDLAEVSEALDDVVKDGTRAGAVIDRIRSLFKNAPPSLENLDITEALTEIVALSRGKALKNGVFLQVQLSEGLPTVRGDRVQLQQVMLNLITNAIEAMSDVDNGNRNVRITAGRDDDNVFVTVQDSGPGLTQATLERVFEPFYTTKPTGLGVGLSICRSIIEAHSGALWATNAEKGGAVFSFTLPISASAKSRIGVQDPVTPSQAPQPLGDMVS
ncbi:PAS domain-containing sensor histidine kinase [Sinorhizobium meliloti]|uniref:PAS domain-containing sensor histidine kinase n=1 Tax=Rhizobium meliloti TaxID=382 RepID=UPI000FDB877D|nr:PAS domain-containing sensor histidine kinase [Sinorhizobium meliloti]RVH21077.1 PAS domain-containing sensor histidine kinase [Sinorhizobium meliloti]